MKINDMRYVIEVSRWKSINKASKYLYINQQQLSRIIAAVENELSMEIFNRSTRGAFLTEQGEGVVRKFEEIVALYDSINGPSEPRQVVKGHLRILSEVNIWTSYGRLYKDFVKAFPDIDLSIRTMATEEIVQEVLERDGIGLITTIIGEQMAEGPLPEALEFLPVARDRLMVYGAAGNPYLQKYKTLSLATLVKLPLINFKPYNDAPSLMERVFAHIGPPNIRYEVSDIKVFRELAVQTDALFLSFRRPKYAQEEAITERPLRDKVFFENGILKKRSERFELYELFAHYYLDYFSKLY